MLRPSIVISLFLIVLPSLAFAAPASQPAQDAWPLYAQAIQRIDTGDKAKIWSPAA